jgi:hypothetical protein
VRLSRVVLGKFFSRFERETRKKDFMNLEKLKQAEVSFMDRYPGGFTHPEMVEIGKKHKMDKLVSFAQESFAKPQFQDPVVLIDNLVKLTTRSSMVSVFEKPKFRDYIYSLSDMDRERLSTAVKQRLHGNEQKGFEGICSVLAPGKLNKWSLVSVVAAYYRPNDEVFVKPTTAKGVVAHFELEGLKYHSTPSWEFYTQYRDAIMTMKTHVDPNLSLFNAAFSGFLMMSL